MLHRILQGLRHKPLSYVLIKLSRGAGFSNTTVLSPASGKVVHAEQLIAALLFLFLVLARSHEYGCEAAQRDNNRE